MVEECFSSILLLELLLELQEEEEQMVPCHKLLGLLEEVVEEEVEVEVEEK